MYNSHNRFWPLTLVAEASARTAERKKKKEAVDFALSRPLLPFANIRSSKLLVTRFEFPIYAFQKPKTLNLTVINSFYFLSKLETQAPFRGF
jgi:flagellar assembly factor FliW